MNRLQLYRGRKDQEADKNIGPLLRWKEDGMDQPGWSEISGDSPSFNALWAQWDSLHVENELLKRAWESPDGRRVTMQLVVPTTKIKEVLQEMHNGSFGAHFGINKTLSKIRERFYWVRSKISTRGPLPAHNIGLPFKRTARDVARPLPVIEEGNKETKKEKLPSVHEMLRPKNEVASGRMKTCYDLMNNLVGFQAGDLVWFYIPRRRNDCFPKLSSDWEGPYTKMRIVHLGRFMKYNRSTVD